MQTPDPAMDTASINEEGTRLLRERKFPEALERFTLALCRDRQSWPAWANKGRVLHLLERYPEALNAYERAVDLFPLAAATWYAKAEAERKLEFRRKASDSWAFCLALAGSGQEGLAEKAAQRLEECSRDGVPLGSREAYAAALNGYRAASERGDWVGAAEQLDRAVEAYSDFAKAWQIKALAAGALGDADSALRCYLKAAALDP